MICGIDMAPAIPFVAKTIFATAAAATAAKVLTPKAPSLAPVSSNVADKEELKAPTIENPQVDDAVRKDRRVAARQGGRSLTQLNRGSSVLNNQNTTSSARTTLGV